jgi:zinc/manganese transport system substrate-binding protein
MSGSSRQRRTRRPAARVVAVALIACASAACGSMSTAAGGGKIVVVAAENVWGNIAAQIGGTHVSVTSIITDPKADPHTYETDPRDAAAISGAAMVIENGAGYDDFIDRLLSTNSNAQRDVLNLARTVGLGGGNPNPHLWYDPGYVTRAATAIADHLASHDAADAGAFHGNLRTFLTAYQPYIDTLNTIRSKYRDDPIAYTERVPGYLVQDAGLRLATPASFAQAIEDGNEPSPGDTAAMNAAISQRLVKVLLYNSQVSSPATEMVKSLAAQSGVPVVGVSETIPGSEPTMQRWQIDQAEAILAALGR